MKPRSMGALEFAQQIRTTWKRFRSAPWMAQLVSWVIYFAWELYNRSRGWSRLFLAEAEVKRLSIQVPAACTPLLHSEIHFHDESRAGFGLCKFWVQVAFWGHGENQWKVNIQTTNYPKPKSRNCQLLVNGMVVIGWMEWVSKLQGLGEKAT